MLQHPIFFTKLMMALLLLGLAACGGGGVGSSNTATTTTPLPAMTLALMVDSFGQAVPEFSFGAGDAAASGADGTVADDGPLAGATVKIVDSTNRSVTTKTDSSGYYRVRIDGFTPPLVASVVTATEIGRVSPSVVPVKIRGFITINLTGLTDKLASDVAVAAGLRNSAQLTPALLAANAAALQTAKTALNTQLSYQITKAGLNPATFDPVATPFKTGSNGYDVVLKNAGIGKSPTGATLVTPKYSIGGIISGLTVSGDILGIRNGNDVFNAFSGATRFNFASTQPQDSTYSVVVTKQVANLDCEVANGSGIVPASDVTSVQVVCKPPPTIALQLYDQYGYFPVDNRIRSGAFAYTAQASLRDNMGVALPNQVVIFSADAALVTFSNGTVTAAVATSITPVISSGLVSTIFALTDAQGIAKVELVGKSAGSAYINAATTVGQYPLSLARQYYTSGVAVGPSALPLLNVFPNLMVVSSASLGAKKSTMTFQLLDELSWPVSGQSVLMSLDAATISNGVSFNVNGTANVATQSVITDRYGMVQIAVNSGKLPITPVITATLASNPALKTLSVGALNITTGTIRSLWVDAYPSVIEAFTQDGVSTKISIVTKDSQGNPAPAGTIINLVTTHGLLVSANGIANAKGTCTVDEKGQCQLTLKSAGVHPKNGLVTVLAYADGEEAFIDLNNNYVWDASEPFTDIGVAYLDTNANGVYDPGIDQRIEGGKTGTALCLANNPSNTIANTCDRIWSDSILVRNSTQVLWATSQLKMVQLGTRSLSELGIRVTDLNGNFMPTGTTLSVEKSTPDTMTGGCKVVTKYNDDMTTIRIILNGDTACATEAITVTGTTPSGVKTVQVFK